jgi:hypothetical protein
MRIDQLVEATMKAIIILNLAGPDVLAVQDFPEPESAGQVRAQL